MNEAIQLLAKNGLQVLSPRTPSHAGTQIPAN